VTPNSEGKRIVPPFCIKFCWHNHFSFCLLESFPHLTEKTIIPCRESLFQPLSMSLPLLPCECTFWWWFLVTNEWLRLTLCCGYFFYRKEGYQCKQISRKVWSSRILWLITHHNRFCSFLLLRSWRRKWGTNLPRGRPKGWRQGRRSLPSRCCFGSGRWNL